MSDSRQSKKHIMNQLDSAITAATLLHAGQTDKGGLPYILHPLRVMQAMGVDASEDERVVAVLHDVVEDCGVTFANLRGLGFTDAQIDAIDAISHRKGHETHTEYILRCRQNPLARRVKLADIADNMGPERMARLGPKFDYLPKKYEHAIALLNEVA